MFVSNKVLVNKVLVSNSVVKFYLLRIADELAVQLRVKIKQMLAIHIQERLLHRVDLKFHKQCTSRSETPDTLQNLQDRFYILASIQH